MNDVNFFRVCVSIRTSKDRSHCHMTKYEARLRVRVARGQVLLLHCGIPVKECRSKAENSSQRLQDSSIERGLFW